MFKILFTQLRRVCRNAQRADMIAGKSQERVGTEIAYANLNTSKSHCSRTARNNGFQNPGCDDDAPGSAKFRSPRRDAHKKDRRDTVTLAPGMVRESERGVQQTGLVKSGCTVNICFTAAEKRTTCENT